MPMWAARLEEGFGVDLLSYRKTDCRGPEDASQRRMARRRPDSHLGPGGRDPARCLPAGRLPGRLQHAERSGRHARL